MKPLRTFFPLVLVFGLGYTAAAQRDFAMQMLPKPLPARTFVGVAALPAGAQIEIEVVAAKK